MYTIRYFHFFHKIPALQVWCLFGWGGEHKRRNRCCFAAKLEELSGCSWLRGTEAAVVCNKLAACFCFKAWLIKSLWKSKWCRKMKNPINLVCWEALCWEDWRGFHAHPSCVFSLNITVAVKLSYSKGQKGLLRLYKWKAVKLFSDPDFSLSLTHLLEGASHTWLDLHKENSCKKQADNEEREQRGLVKSNRHLPLQIQQH